MSVVDVKGRCPLRQVFSVLSLAVSVTYHLPRSCGRANFTVSVLTLTFTVHTLFNTRPGHNFTRENINLTMHANHYLHQQVLCDFAS